MLYFHHTMTHILNLEIPTGFRVWMLDPIVQTRWDVARD